MKQLAAAFTILMIAGVVNAQSYSHNYERFFGKDDRIGLYSDAAEERFSENILKTARENTLLMDCGTQGKPSTAFVAENKIYSAAHNLVLSQTKGIPCKIGALKSFDGKASPDFQNSGLKTDTAHDVAIWPNVTQHQGFKICQTIETDSKYVVLQSIDGTDRLGFSPICKVKSIDNTLITTSCRGHYKASGGPLLKVSKTDVCVAGVFNAHSGKLFGYESYAAKLTP